jgi:hypothetical protein
MVYCTFNFSSDTDGSKGDEAKRYLNEHCKKTSMVSSHSIPEKIYAYEINQAAVIIRTYNEKVLDGVVIGAIENVRGLVRVLNIGDTAFSN